MRLLPEAVVDATPIFKARCRFKLLKILEMVTAPPQGTARAAAVSRVACSFLGLARTSERLDGVRSPLLILKEND